MNTPQPEAIASSRAYWTHKVDAFPGPVAQFRMAQLIDLDERLYETARIVYRFLVGWYHDDHGDALLSQRHVAKVMKQRAPEGAAVPSRNAVQRAIIALMETGWVVRTFQGRGKGKGASRYVPVVNVLELAAQGKFPEPAHSNGPVDGQDELAHDNGPLVAHATGPVDSELAQFGGPKTRLPDPPKGAGTGSINDVSPAGGPAAVAPAAAEGFERIWKAYGKLGNKTAAREAFAAIVNSDVEHIVARATSWAASAKPGQKRMPLERWLASEKYDEADRRVKPAPKAVEAKKPDKPNTPEPFQERREAALILSVEVDDGTLLVDYQIENGNEHRLYMHLESDDPAKQERGQNEFGRLCDAVGLGSVVEDSEELVGRRFIRVLRSKFGHFEFERPRDVEPQKARAYAPPTRQPSNSANDFIAKLKKEAAAWQ